ncbi:MAG TPA: PD-(D/E)XK nuclease family protein, partial [bacterium]|nr:PD-(D/E)XK nuclease family protein [bacterium]
SDESIYLFRGGGSCPVFSGTWEHTAEKICLPAPQKTARAVRTSHPDEYLEVFHALRKIRRLLRKGISPEEICIILRTADLRVKILEDLSRAFNLPLEVNAGVTLFKEPALMHFISFLTMISPLLKPDAPRVIKAFSCPAFEQDLSYFLKSAESRKTDLLKTLLEKKDADEGLSHFFGVADRLRKNLENGAGILATVRSAYRECGYFDLSVEDKQTSLLFHYFISITEEYFSIYPESTYEEYLNSLEEIIQFYGREEYLPPKKESIQVMTVHEAGGRFFSHVFVLGANDGNFPRHYRPDTFPFFTSSEREKMGLSPVYSLEEHLEEERRIFRKALSRAGEYLYISSVETQDGPVVSPFLGEMAEQAHIEKEESEELFLPGKKEDILDEDEFGTFYAPAPAPFRREDLLKPFLLPKEFRFSYSKLDLYRRCPLRFFLQELLHIRLPAAWGAEKGKIVHRIMKELHSNWPRNPFPDEAGGFLQRRTEEELAGLSFLTLWEKEHYKNRIIRTLRSYTEKAVRFEVLETETKADLEKNGRSFNLRVDRIDRENGGVVIVDYKTGKETGGERKLLNQFQEGKEIQFTLYSEVLSSRYPSIEAFRIIRLQDETAFITLSAEKVRRFLPGCWAGIEELCRKIEEGDLRPGEKQQECFGCLFKDVCLHE